MEGQVEVAGGAQASEERDELEFLSSAALRLAELHPDEDPYQLVAEQLAALSPETVVIANSYEPGTGSTIVRGLAGPEDMRSQAEALIGQEIVGLRFRMNEEARQGMAEGKLVRVEGGLYQLTFYGLSLSASREIEARLGIRSVHAQPFTRKCDFLGTAALISRARTLRRARLMEAFIHLAAVAIQRRQAEAQLRRSESLFRMLAENSQDIVFRFSFKPKRGFEYVSPATTSLLGWTPQDLYASPELGPGLVHPEDRILLEGSLERAPGQPLVVRWKRKDETYVWTELKLTPIRDRRGEVLAVEGSARDITARKEAEKALLEADRRKTEFLAVLSHELRNPLTPIRNSLYILERAALDGEQAKRARAIIDRQINYLVRLVDDLLDVTRISRGKIQLQKERVDLDELVRATAEDHRSLFRGGGVELDVAGAPGPVWVMGDRTRIAQIVGNLLQNAAKFTPPGGRASLSVSIDPAARQAAVRVTDTGAGLTPELLPHLFEPFMQADRTLDRSRGGLGLGLALVKGLAEMHGGSVAAESRGPGTGTTFVVRLPLEQAGAPAGEAAQPAAHEGPSRRVLVIEDNVDAATSLREVLELGEYTVEVAHSGAEGIEKARAFRPGIVLCDIGLPGMDGYSVARVMRGDPALRAIWLVALTGYAGHEDIEKSRKAGFDRHLAKPATIEDLEQVIADLRRAG